MKAILRRWRWILAITVAVILCTLIVLWLLFQHVPAWYRPSRIAPENLQQVRNDMAAAYDAFGSKLNSAREPFTFTLMQDQLNNWLMARESVDPKTAEWFPPSIRDPMVLIETGGVRLAATYTGDGFQTVVSARLQISADAQGVHARLDQVAGGSLGVPQALIQRGLEALDVRTAAAIEQHGLLDEDHPEARLNKLLEGVVLPNEVTWPGTAYRFRVLGIETQPGRITFKLERIAPAHRER